MKQIALAAAVLSLAAAGCSGGPGSSGSSDSANKPVEKVIGAAGGTITTSDGRMKLDIPAGALDADVTISITPQPDGSYRLEPAGLQFSVPATATFTLPADGPVQVETDDGSLVIPNAVAPQLFTLTGADGKEEGLSSAVSRTAGANHVTVSVPVPHFSVIRRVAGSKSLSTFTGVELEKDKYDVGEQFTARMLFFSDPEAVDLLLFESMWLETVEYAGEDAVAYAGPGPSKEEHDQLLAGPRRVLVREPAFRCEKDGQGAVKVRVTILVLAPDRFDRFGSPTVMEVRVPVTCGSDGDHDGGETGNVLVNGNHALPEGMTGPDGFTLLMGQVLDELGGWKALQFMGTEGGVVTLGYNSPPQVIDLSEAGFLSSGWSGQTYGVLAFTTPDDGVEFFAYGPSGSAAQGYTATNGFGMTVLRGAALDASTIGGGLRHAHGYVVPGSMGFTSYEWSEEDGFLVMNNIHAPQVNAVSAYQHRVGGPILAVSGGEGGSGSGKLKVVDRSGDMPAATDIGDVGDTPRRLRCLVPVCVVSNHGSNSLSVITWDGESLTPSIVGTVAVGKGPVGVDLVRVSDNVAVVSTGFNDDTYSVTVLKPDGNVVSNENYDAPAGCESPAHAMFAEDAGKLKIVMTCYGSGSIAITDAPF